MKIGSAWRCQSEDKTKDWIGVKLDDTILELCPQLKNLSIKLWPLSPEERTQENSPHYSVSANPKQEPKEKKEG
jgi:uncharacterized protein (DUF736 family)